MDGDGPEDEDAVEELTVSYDDLSYGSDRMKSRCWKMVTKHMKNFMLPRIQ